MRIALVGVGLLTAVWAGAALPARATYGARTTADEPQYLLSALSLYEDRSLDISDELRADRWRDFHEAALPEQTKLLDDGRRLSPHDPLLPAVLAIPMGLGGWVGAKAALGALAGGLAALLVWTAHRRFSVPLALAVGVVLAFSLSSPLAAYGAQVYPELPAALVVTIAVAALTGPMRRAGVIVLALAVVALPWLAVKYAPVAAALAIVGLARLWRSQTGVAQGHIATSATPVRGIGVLVGVWIVAAAVYLGFHRAVYGGWTVYAAGDHFVGGELTVAGVDPNYLGRARRLIGLLVDRSFGLAAWAPVYLLAVAALGAILRRRPRGWAVLVLPLAAGWLPATFVALTMHGYWWPGRQTVVVLPLAVLLVAWWVAQVRITQPRVVALFGGLAAAGVLLWAWVVGEVLAGHRRLIIDFDQTSNPLYRLWRLVLPDERVATTSTDVLHVMWIVVVALLAIVGWHSLRDRQRRSIHEDTDTELATAGRSGDPAVVGGRGRVWG